MATVKEILKQTGWTDEQIAALDAKQMSGFETVLTTAETAQTSAAQKEAAATAAAAKAEQDRIAAENSAKAAKAAQDAAELAQRANKEFYETSIVPGLTGWQEEQVKLQNDKANAEALAAFYKAQNEGAKAAGFLPADAPAFTPPAAQPPRNTSGQYVSGAPGSTPGSPGFVDPTVYVSRAADGFNVISDIAWKYQSLYGGQTLPIPPSELIKQADAMKLTPMAYAERTFNFAAKEEERRQAAAKAHDDSITAAAVAAQKIAHDAELKKITDEFAAKERLRAEQVGNNPDVRQAPGSSKFAEVARAVKAGTLPDPLKMTDAQRRAATRQQIHAEIAQNAEHAAA